MAVDYISVFSTATQQLLYVTQGVISNIADYANPDHALFLGKYDTSYLCSADGLTVSAKTEIPYTASDTTLVADGIATITLARLPDGAALTVLGESETETAGSINFSVDLSGSYDLLLEHPHYLNTTVTVTAT